MVSKAQAKRNEQYAEASLNIWVFDPNPDCTRWALKLDYGDGVNVHLVEGTVDEMRLLLRDFRKQQYPPRYDLIPAMSFEPVAEFRKDMFDDEESEAAS